MSWDDAVRRYARLVYSIPRRFGLSRQDADDVFQSTFLTAVRRREVPPGEDRIVPFLVSIACWETRGLLRKRRPEPAEPDVVARLRADAAVPPTVLEEAEDLQALADALAALRPRDREIVEALFLADQPPSYAELARRLGVATGSVGALRQRAMDRLREELLRRGF